MLCFVSLLRFRDVKQQGRRFAVVERGGQRDVASPQQDHAVLFMPEKKEDAYFADQCAVRRAFDYDEPASMEKKYELTAQAVRNALRKGLPAGREPIPEVMERVLPERRWHASIERMANRVVAKNGEQVVDFYRKKLKAMNEERIRQQMEPAQKLRESVQKSLDWLEGEVLHAAAAKLIYLKAIETGKLPVANQYKLFQPMSPDAMAGSVNQIIGSQAFKPLSEMDDQSLRALAGNGSGNALMKKYLQELSKAPLGQEPNEEVQELRFKEQKELQGGTILK